MANRQYVFTYASAPLYRVLFVWYLKNYIFMIWQLHWRDHEKYWDFFWKCQNSHTWKYTFLLKVNFWQAFFSKIRVKKYTFKKYTLEIHFSGIWGPEFSLSAPNLQRSFWDQSFFENLSNMQKTYSLSGAKDASASEKHPVKEKVGIKSRGADYAQWGAS